MRNEEGALFGACMFFGNVESAAAGGLLAEATAEAAGSGFVHERCGKVAGDAACGMAGEVFASAGGESVMTQSRTVASRVVAYFCSCRAILVSTEGVSRCEQEMRRNKPSRRLSRGSVEETEKKNERMKVRRKGRKGKE